MILLNQASIQACPHHQRAPSFSILINVVCMVVCSVGKAQSYCFIPIVRLSPASRTPQNAPFSLDTYMIDTSTVVILGNARNFR